jgi:hypothetical protein
MSGTVAHSCNTSYLDRGRRPRVQDQPSKKKVSKNMPEKTSWAWRCMPIIPDTQEAKVRRIAV